LKPRGCLAELGDSAGYEFDSGADDKAVMVVKTAAAFPSMHWVISKTIERTDDPCTFDRHKFLCLQPKWRALWQA